MKFGLSLSPLQWWTKTEQFNNCIFEVEQLEYDAIFVPDHYSLPQPPEAPLMDAWTTLSYIAAKTSKVRIGSLVTPVPRWIPSQLAKVITSVDILSNGRVIAPLGVGYYRAEFVNYAPGGIFDEPRVRFEKFLEGVEIILRLWTEESVTFKGRYYFLVDATLYPKPVQKPHPPIWSGGSRPRVIEATAKYFDGWVPAVFRVPVSFDRRSSMLPSPEEYRIRVEKIKEYLKEFGRDERNFTFAALGGIGVNAKFVEEYKEAGCQYYVADLAPPGEPIPNPTQCLKMTKKFAEEVIQSFL